MIQPPSNSAAKKRASRRGGFVIGRQQSDLKLDVITMGQVEGEEDVQLKSVRESRMGGKIY